MAEVHDCLTNTVIQQQSSNLHGRQVVEDRHGNKCTDSSVKSQHAVARTMSGCYFPVNLLAVEMHRGATLNFRPIPHKPHGF